MVGGEGSTEVIANALEQPLDAMGLALQDLVDKGWIAIEQDGPVTYARWRQILAEQIVIERSRRRGAPTGPTSCR